MVRKITIDLLKAIFVILLIFVILNNVHCQNSGILQPGGAGGAGVNIYNSNGNIGVNRYAQELPARYYAHGYFPHWQTGAGHTLGNSDLGWYYNNGLHIRSFDSVTTKFLTSDYLYHGNMITNCFNGDNVYLYLSWNGDSIYNKITGPIYENEYLINKNFHEWRSTTISSGDIGYMKITGSGWNASFNGLSMLPQLSLNNAGWLMETDGQGANYSTLFATDTTTAIRSNAILLNDASGSGTGAANTILTNRGGDLGAKWMTKDSIFTNDSINSNNIKTGAITTPKLSDSAITSIKIKSTTVTPGTYTNATVTVNQSGQLTAASSGASGAAPKIITPSQITVNQNDYTPTGWATATTIRISGDNGIRAVTGAAAGSSWEQKNIINVGSFPVYFPGENPSSSAANRFSIEKDYILFPKQSVNIFYDSTSTRWRFMSDFTIEGKTGVFYDWTAGSIDTIGMGPATLQTSASYTAQVSTTALPASISLNTAGGSTYSRLYFSKSQPTFTAFGSAHIYVEGYISTTATGGAEYAMAITNQPRAVAAEPSNTVELVWGTGINGGKFEIISFDNAGATATADTGISWSANTLYKLLLEIDKANSEVRAYINDVYVARVTTHLPNNVVCGSAMLISTASLTLRVHKFRTGAIYP